MDSLNYPNGERVHCGTVLKVKVHGEWIYGRFEIGSGGLGYFVLANDRCVNLDAVTGFDFDTAKESLDLR